MRELWIATLGILTAAAVAGCAPNMTLRQATDAAATCTPGRDGRVHRDEVPACENAAVEANDQYKLVVVEFDDQGRLRDDRQLDNAFKVIETEARRQEIARPGRALGMQKARRRAGTLDVCSQGG